MTKTEKRQDKAIRVALTQACELAKDQVHEFSWLTHTADLKKLPQSLKVSCYCKEPPLTAEQTQLITNLIIKELSAVDLAINAKAISFLKE
ncbi:hypothetical protein L1264_16250 [Pseudoalteromonas sp. APAL1]|uniref:hypothetical protein n=1 Tax=Pseudoalteromonas TaxID=53246 RepID=UPI000ECB7514|nr:MULTISPECIES: hypothetical protein [unclassified Pseudoalteromonas]MCF2922024.1 hypothetical protein [Pseudoalteromonas sp. APAL1]HCV04906.1 hypothetical protein [Pseudoalteromonas sp.]|tara:strand:- start:506 stop:778 length:273 start_codon:yes stop_codon:yes gene_type:complete